MANFWALIKLLNQLIPLLIDAIKTAKGAILKYKIEKSNGEIRVVFEKVSNNDLNDEDLSNEAGNLNDTFK